MVREVRDHIGVAQSGSCIRKAQRWRGCSVVHNGAQTRTRTYVDTVSLTELHPTRGAANCRGKPVGRCTPVYLAAETVSRSVSKHQTRMKLEKNSAYLVPAPSPTRIEPAGRLQLSSVKCPEQLVDVVLLSPGLCTGELFLRLVEVESTCS